jgi:putative membrane protein
MAQHGLLVGVAPPLLLLGRPSVAFAWIFGPSAASHPSTTMMWLSLNAFARELATPLRATMLQGVVLWIWHAPALFDAALEQEWLHAMEHLCFFVSALLFWQVLLNCRRGRHAAAAFAAAFVTFMHSGLLGGLITMAPAPLYLAYAGRTQSWGLSPIEDQQLAGLFMWLPLGLPYLVAGLVLASGLVLESREDPGTRRLPVSSVTQR